MKMNYFTTSFCIFILLNLFSSSASLDQSSSKNCQKTDYCHACNGRDGRDGLPGPMGRDGKDGLQGPMGINGKDGIDGRDGKDGKNGKNGRDGQPGSNGRDGKDGKNGAPGKAGKDGVKGPPGKSGPAGKDGTDGKDGAPGPPGRNGKDGKDASPENWKECAWDKVNDGKDTGLIKYCDFNKKAASTYLRVSVISNMRIHGCNGCCRRWYVTFDNAECSPVPIDVVVYMANQDGKYGDLHRPRFIKGNCNISKRGKVRVGFSVGNCPGYGNADAFTGWQSSTRIMVEEVRPPQQ